VASLKTAIYDHLSGKSAVTAIVSTRIYPRVAPAWASRPYIVYHLISNDHQHNLGGGAPLTGVRIQIDCWADDSEDLETLKEAVRDNMDTFRGAMGDDSLDVRSCLLQDESDDHESPTDATDQGPFRTRMDFMIWHVETAPTLP